MFILDTNNVFTAMYARGQKVETDIDLWHKRFGHVNFTRLQDMQSKKLVFGPLKFSAHKDQVWEACQLEKQHQLPFPNESNRSHNCCDLIHTNVWGPTENVSLGGNKYFVSFIDDFSRHTWIFSIQKKSKVFPCFLQLKSLVEKEKNRKIRCLRSDGGTEYFSDEFTTYLLKEGIYREYSYMYTPQ
jgi:hypothetical protein